MAAGKVPERHYRSEGQRLLCALPGTRDQIAKSLGVSGSMVGFLKAGTKRPGDKVQSRAEALGIPRSAWGVVATVDAGDAVARPVAPAATAPALPPASAADELGTTLEEVESWLRVASRVRDRYLDDTSRDRPTDAEAFKAAELANRLLASRAKLKGDARSDEEKLAQSPRWGAIRSVLAKVLARHPDAGREVADALEAEGLG